MDPYEHIAAYYDCEHDKFVEDINFYLDHIAGGPVLEVGAGTGRIMLPLLQSGLEVWGIDVSAAMLRRAERRVGRLNDAHLIHGEVQDVPRGSQFSTVILPLNTIWHAPDNQAQIRLLRDVKDRMSKGSRLFIDVSNPLSLVDRGSRGTVRERFTGECGGEQLRILSATWDDEAEQNLRVSLTYEATAADGSLKRTQVSLQLRYLYRYELELVLRSAGFSVLDVFGSYAGDPYAAESPNLIIVARVD